MFSACMRTSRNLLLTPSSSSSWQDEWSAGSTFVSTVNPYPDEDEEEAEGDMFKIKKKKPYSSSCVSDHRFPHSLRLDEERIVYAFCDLHPIPEGQPVCKFHQVVHGNPNNKRWARRNRNLALNSEEFYQVLHKALQEERLLSSVAATDDEKCDSISSDKLTNEEDK